MKFSKKFLVKAASLSLAVVMTAGMFAGCGQKAANDKDDQGRTVVSIGGYPTSAGKTKDAWDARKVSFEAENSDAAIKPDEFAFDLRTFYAKAAGGTLPNMFNSNFTEVEQCIGAGYTADITEALKKRGYDGKFNQKVLDVVSDDKGNIYAFPTSAYVLGFAMNMNLCKAAGLVEADGTPMQPKTWDEVAEFAVKIKEATGKAGLVVGSSANYGGWLFTPIAWSYGTEFMKKEDGKWKATFDSPECAAALQYIKDLKWKYDVLPANTLVDGTEYFKQFATDNAGMMIAAGDYPRNLTQYGFDPNGVGMVGLPAGPKRHVTLMGGYVWNFSANSTADQLDVGLRWAELDYGYTLTEAYKKNQIDTLDTAIENNQAVGIIGLSPYNDSVETIKFSHDLIKEKANININQVRLYNEFVANLPCEVQPEEPCCAQELYAILDGCIQEVLTNKDADCAAVVKKANSDFQTNYLDNVAY